jgi:hypothetical protein
MNAVLQAIYEGRISCSFCYEVLLNYLGMSSERFSYSSLVADYGDGGLLGFSLHCIKVVYHGYISRGLAAIDVELDNLPHSRYEYIKMFTCCKDRAYRRTMQIRDSERYLGIRSFEDELRRSFDVFLMIVKNVFGFGHTLLEKSALLTLLCKWSVCLCHRILLVYYNFAII